MNKSEIILNYYNHLEKLSDDISNINIQLQSISLLLKKNQHFLEKQKYFKNKKIILLKGGDGFDKFENMNVDCDNVKKLFDTFYDELQIEISIIDFYMVESYMLEFEFYYEKFKNIFVKHKSDYEENKAMFENEIPFEDPEDSSVFFKLNQILNNLFYIIFDLIHHINSKLKDVNKEYDVGDQVSTFSYNILTIYNNFTKKINKYITDSIRTIKGIETETEYSDRIKSKIDYRIKKIDSIESNINYSDIKSELERGEIPNVGSSIFKNTTYISPPNNEMPVFFNYETKETYLVIYPDRSEYGHEINVHRYITYICNIQYAKEIDIKSSFILLNKSNEIPFEYGYTDTPYIQGRCSSFGRTSIFFQYQKYDTKYGTNLIEVLKILLYEIKKDTSSNLNCNIIPLISLIFELFYTFYLLNHILCIIVNCRFEHILVEKLISPKKCKYYIYDTMYTFYKFYNVRISNFTDSEFIIDKVGLLTSEIKYYMITYEIIMQIILLLIHTLDEDQSNLSTRDKITYSYNKKIIKNLIDLILNFDPNLFQLITNYMEENPDTYNTLLNVNSYLHVNGYLSNGLPGNSKITMIYLLLELLKNSFIQKVLFNRYFDPYAAHVIPYYWLPKWSGNITDPSARVLDVYNE